MAITPRQAIPREWVRNLTGGPIGIGHDIATTAKKKSNPSSITVTERTGGRYFERLVLVYKTDSEEVALAMLETVFQDILESGRKPRRVSVDASSEVYYAQRIKRKLVKYCAIELVKSGATVVRGSETFSYKNLLGNLYATAYEDGFIACPGDKWYRDDQRRVLRSKGTFETELGENGEHGEVFDSGKLAYWSLEHGTGRVEAEAAAVGNGVGQGPQRTGLKNPFAALFRDVFRTNF